MTGSFQIAVHIFTLLHAAGNEFISSDYIAGSVNINPVLIRKELSHLRSLGLIASKEGKSGGYSLGKSADLINMADIYEAVMINPVLGKARNMPNPKCPIGRQINGHLTDMDADITRIITDNLRKQTLADFYKQFDK